MANKKPTIVSIEFDTQRITYIPDGAYRPKVDRWNYMVKNGKIAALQFAGYAFRGKTPIRFTDEELASAWQIMVSANQGTTKTREPEDMPQPIPTPYQPTKEAPKVTIPSQPSTSTGGLDDILRDIVTQVLGNFVPEVDEDKIMEVVNGAMAPYVDAFDQVTAEIVVLADTVANLQPKVTEIHLPHGEIKRLGGVQHFMFNKVLANLSEGIPTYLVGPAGTGKSTIAENASKALGLEFSSKSCSSQSTESSLLGYMSATGDYVSTEFRKRFELGGVFLLDEVDNGNPNVLTVLNSSLSNSFMAFPDGMVQRHESFVLIATANTFGHGATAEYVGRNPLDQAFLDRFGNLNIGYDEAIEQAMLDSIELDSMTASKWLNVVRVARQNVFNYGLKVVVSPRATVHGAKMLRHKDAYSLREVAEATILKGAKPEQVEKILMGIAL